VLASYLLPQKTDKTFLLLVEYPTRKSAGEALQSFVKVYMPEATSAKTIQTENRKWVTALTYQEFVIVVFDAPLKEKAEELIQATKKQLGARRP
jgi:hypothetical protein